MHALALLLASVRGAAHRLAAARRAADGAAAAATDRRRLGRRRFGRHRCRLRLLRAPGGRPPPAAPPSPRSRCPCSCRSCRAVCRPPARRCPSSSSRSTADRDRRSCRARRARAGRRACRARFPCSRSGGRALDVLQRRGRCRCSSRTCGAAPWASACPRGRRPAGRRASRSRSSCSPRSGSGPRGRRWRRSRPCTCRTSGAADRWAGPARRPRSVRQRRPGPLVVAAVDAAADGPVLQLAEDALALPAALRRQRRLDVGRAREQLRAAREHRRRACSRGRRTGRSCRPAPRGGARRRRTGRPAAAAWLANASICCATLQVQVPLQPGRSQGRSASLRLRVGCRGRGRTSTTPGRPDWRRRGRRAWRPWPDAIEIQVRVQPGTVQADDFAPSRSASVNPARPMMGANADETPPRRQARRADDGPVPERLACARAMAKVDKRHLHPCRSRSKTSPPSRNASSSSCLGRTWPPSSKRPTTRSAAACRLPGFRPGKVPRALIEKMYKRQVEDEVARDLVEHSIWPGHPGEPASAGRAADRRGAGDQVGRAVQVHGAGRGPVAGHAEGLRRRAAVAPPREGDRRGRSRRRWRATAAG